VDPLEGAFFLGLIAFNEAQCCGTKMSSRRGAFESFCSKISIIILQALQLGLAGEGVKLLKMQLFCIWFRQFL
jgi:hypothetical protein